MTDNNPGNVSCDETSCKDDLMGGLMNLFAQIDAEESRQESPADED